MDRVLDMLAACADGYTLEEKKHHFWVRYNGKAYLTLPLGKHGRRFNVEIEFGHVRSLMRALGIEACGREFFN